MKQMLVNPVLLKKKRLSHFGSLLFFVVLFYPSIIEAQNVNIPDAHFKNKLIALGIDTNNDGEISIAEAAGVTGLLNVSGTVYYAWANCGFDRD